MTTFLLIIGIWFALSVLLAPVIGRFLRHCGLFLLLGTSCFAAPTGFYSPTPTLNYGLVGWWTMNEGSGTNAADMSGNGNTGYLTNSPAWTNGLIGKALSATGTSNSVVYITKTISSYGISTNGTISCWFYPTVQQTHTIIGDYSNSFGLFIRVESATAITFAVYPGDSRISNATASIPTNTWSHIVAQLNGTGIELYVNGTIVGTNSLINPLSGGSVTAFGNRSLDNSTTCKGLLDDVRIYSRALAAAEIKQLYGGGYGAQ